MNKADLDVATPHQSKRKKILRGALNQYIWKKGNNIMRPNTKIYWRVDPDFGNGPVRGAIWSFTVAAAQNAPIVASCKTFSGVGATLNDRQKDGNPNTYLPMPVPVNGGMSSRHSVASVEVCIDATYPNKDMMRALTFKLRQKNSNSAVS